MLTLLCMVFLYGLAGAQRVLPDITQNATTLPATEYYPYQLDEITWGGPPSGCSGADGIGRREVKCALPAGDVTLTFDPTKRRLTLECNRGSYRCSELQQAREHLDRAISDSLSSLQVDRCEVREPLACVLALVNATGAASVRLEQLRGGLLPAQVHKLTAVTRLRVSVVDGNISSIPYSVLSQLPYLTSFSLLRANISLSEQPSASLPWLSRLELADGELTKLPAGAFSNLPNLTQLNLWGNKISEIHEDALQGLSRLRNLSLNNNQLRDVPRGLLRPTRALRLLHAYGNSLNILPRGLLTDLLALEEVKIFNNKASLVLEDGVFSGLPSLRYLKLDFSGIDHLPGQFLADTPLKTLSLRGNRLTTLPSKIFNTELTELDLSNNNISDLPGDAFGGLVSLRTLDLSSNGLRELPSGLLAPLAALTGLNLRSNALERLESGSFVGLSSLTELKLSSNRLSELRAVTFDPLQKLQELTCAHNGLRLAVVSQKGYKEELSSPFRSLIQLRRLDLHNNSLQELASDWRLFLHLKELNLANNRIEELTDVDMEFLSIVTVDLQHNNITRLSPPPTSNNVSAATLKVDGNPFRCDCYLYRYALALKTPSPVHLEGGTCVTPPDLKGRPLASLDPERLVCAVRDCPQGCDCTERPAKQRLEMRCQRAPQVFPSDPEGDFDVELRLMTAPESQLLDLPPHVKFLDLSGLNLTEPPRVRGALEINLRDNRLVRPPLQLLETNCSVLIARNPLRCDCDAAAELAALVMHAPRTDLNNATCDDGAPLAALRVQELCAGRRAAVLSGALAGATLLLALVLLVLCRRYRAELRVLFRKWGLDGVVDDAEYDLFVSYAHEDEEFVRDTLMPRLEEQGLVLCVHERDWTPGDWIPEQIAHSVEQSRRTLVVLSRHFLRSRWARLEFCAAHALNRVLVLVLDEAALGECTDAELRAYVATNTYVRAADPRVWGRLTDVARRPRPSDRLGRVAERLVSTGVQLQPPDLKSPESTLERQSEDLKSQTQSENLSNWTDRGGKRPDELLLKPNELQRSADLMWPDDVQKQARSLHAKLDYSLSPGRGAPPRVHFTSHTPTPVLPM